MPEYLAPGVYVEEVSFRSKSIEGVSTTTTGFIGPTAFGPFDLEPDIVTSLGEFELIYGSGTPLNFGTNGGILHNYMWHAVRAFFAEGGKRLYISRVFTPNASADQGRAGVKILDVGSAAAASAKAAAAMVDAVAANVAASGGVVTAATAARDAAAAAAADPADAALAAAAATAASVASDAATAAATLAAEAAAVAAAAVTAATALAMVDSTSLAAKTAADNAKTKADEAQTAADEAEARAEEAKTKAEEAVAAPGDAAKADAAKVAADGAKAAADTSKTEADGAKTAADAAKTATDNAVAEADKAAFYLKARFPGAAGNMKATFTLNVSPNILGKQRNPVTTADTLSFAGLNDHDVVFYRADPTTANDKVAIATLDTVAGTFTFTDMSGATPSVVTMPAASALLDATRPPSMHIITLNLALELPNGAVLTYSGLSPDPRRTRGGQPESMFDFFTEFPTNLAIRRTVPVFMRLVAPATTTLKTGQAVLRAVYASNSAIQVAVRAALGNTPQTPIVKQLTGGNDGQLPGVAEFEGKAELTSLTKTGLKQFEDIEDISIVAAPGATAGYEKSDAARARAQTINNLLIAHAQYMRYRIAVLDSGENQTVAQVRAMRAQMDSKYAALYFPWVRIFDPITRQQITLPPSGFISGIYARNDINRAVYKAPANEVVTLAIGFEQLLNKAQQEVLNPEGINCLRFFEGRGYLVWGARTISSDSEWKYVNLRRYFAYLERSLERGTQWAVFEPNGERLWANVRTTIEDFLLNEWQNGALLGDKPEKAYFVRCDRSTMTQNDLDNGRLICLIGVAALRPAEFVIFRIGQWTSDRKS